MKKQNVRTLSLIVCEFAYLLIGAAIFDALESESEKIHRERLFAIESKIKTEYNISDDNWTTIEETVIELVPHKAGIQWKFTGAFYFCVTVLTTIGYGHTAPTTDGGKVFCMVYACIGIPISLVMFQSVGERLNTLTSYILKSIKKCLKLKKTDVSHTNLVVVGGAYVTIIIAAGAAAFSYFESWLYLDSLYFMFITITTIGFGDFVALQKAETMRMNPGYVAFTLIYIMVGLAVIGASLNLLVLRLLTLNTEDERKEQEEREQAALNRQNPHITSSMQGIYDIEANTTENGTLHIEYVQSSQTRESPPVNTRHHKQNHLLSALCTCSCFSSTSSSNSSSSPQSQHQPVRVARQNNCTNSIPLNNWPKTIYNTSFNYNGRGDSKQKKRQPDDDNDDVFDQFKSSQRNNHRASI